jgi:hypothetical protein
MAHNTKLYEIYELRGHSKSILEMNISKKLKNFI